MKRLFIKVADTPSKREMGLMFCKAMDKNSGMMFKFPYAHHLRFWMKNTYIPLDIAFMDDDGKILQIETMNPLSTKAITSVHPCKYALEVNGGWFKNNSIEVGNVIGSKVINKKIKLTAKLVDKPKKDKADVTKRTDEAKKERKKDNTHINKTEVPQEDQLNLPDTSIDENNIPEEMEVEGEYPEQPEAIQAIPYENGEHPEIEFVRDLRGKIGVADNHSLEMEIMYTTKRGFNLPPRKVRLMPKGGYELKSGPNGDYVVAFDSSPTIQGDKWSIKGLQPKSFLLDGISSIQLEFQGTPLTDEQIGRLKGGETVQQVMQPQTQQMPLKNKKDLRKK